MMETIDIFISFSNNFLRAFGAVCLSVIVWRISLSIYRRKILPPKKPQEYGKWAIVTGSTSGIGEEFSNYLACKGMSLLLISRSISKLESQAQHISSKYSVSAKFLAFDFSSGGQSKNEFYATTLPAQIQELEKDGGIGLLVNNVGTANEHPTALEEFTDQQLDDMLNCNIQSLVSMTRAVLPSMKQRRSGCVISISSGSGNWCSPYLVVYSATKAFMTQFTRSMHIECWGSGVDFYVACPFYVATALCKRKKGSGINDPIEANQLVDGVMAQIGKKYVWQGNGYWLHGLLQNLGLHSWRSVNNNLTRMRQNRKRYQEKLARSAQESAANPQTKSKAQ